MRAAFVVGGLDVHVQLSGERRFFLSAVDRATRNGSQLGTARWEPGDRAFVLSLGAADGDFPDGSVALETLVCKLDALRAWHLRGVRPAPHLGIVIGDNTASHQTHASL